MKNIKVFLSEKFQYLAVKFSIYLNRHVFVMVRLRYGSFLGNITPLYLNGRFLITKTRLCKCTEILPPHNENFQIKKSNIFSYFYSKYRLWYS